MTAPHVVLELKAPPAVAVLYAASLVVGLGMAIAVVGSGAPIGFVLAFVAIVALVLSVNASTALSSVRAHADGSLEVRNRFRTRRLDRRDVDRVVVDSVGGFGTNRRIELLLVDGTTLPLVATETPPFPWLRQQLEERAAALRSWAGRTAD